ncbi:MAG: hypothetical protein P8H03_01150 [Emcibacteraceae bacterium]|nr:hypothetical protein [Emcibacteraceae bacterium]
MGKPKVIVSSVVRGSQQGESHGGLYTVDFETEKIEQHVDWNSEEIDFEGRGADRGLRGITFDGDDIYVAASDELYCYDRNFKIKGSWRNPYLKHAHEIIRKDRKIFITSTGFDSLLAFDIESQEFMWGVHLIKQKGEWGSFAFDPKSNEGPRPVNNHHINMVHVDDTGIYLSGLNTNALLHVGHQNNIQEVCSLPRGTHNARPFQGGVILNDTGSDQVFFASPKSAPKKFAIKQYDKQEILFEGIDDSKVARQGFGRGLSIYNDRYIVGGSSPSTLSLYDLETGKTVSTINLTMDIRNAIHGLEIWPYE